MQLKFKTKQLDFLLPLKKVGLIVLFFIFIYSLKFNFVPGGIGTRAIIGLVGLQWVLINLVSSLYFKQRLSLKSKYSIIIISLFFLIFFSLLTNAWNSTAESFFLSYPISIILVLVAPYPITKYVKSVYGKVDFELIAKYFIIAVVIQCGIALLMFIFPTMRTILIDIIIHTDGSKMHFDMESFRLIGFGAQFFEAGVINAIALILIASVFKSRVLSISYMFLLMISFVIIVTIGMMMSRTTIIGVPLAGFVLLHKFRFWKLRSLSLFLRAFSLIILLVLLATAIYYLLPTTFINQIEQSVEFGFEMLVNYSSKGELTTGSTKQLINMFDIYPDNAITWLIGNGYWSDPIDPDSYYMSTDVGFARMIFYFGLFGLVSYLIYQASIAWNANLATGGKHKTFFVAMIALLLIFNSKGFTDMSQTLSLFLFIPPDNIN